MQVGPYWLDIANNRLVPVGNDAEEIVLQPVGARFLEILARDPGKLVDRRAIIDEIWRGDFLTGDPALHRVVSEIRHALSDGLHGSVLIQTVHRRGYRLLNSEVEIREPALDARREPLIDRTTLSLLLLLLVIVLGTAAAIVLNGELMALRYH